MTKPSIRRGTRFHQRLIPKKHAPDLIRGGGRFSEKITRKTKREIIPL